eukprot:scaffold154688_cov18-Tisochrysis_lutea.AAC.1
MSTGQEHLHKPHPVAWLQGYGKPPNAMGKVEMVVTWQASYHPGSLSLQRTKRHSGTDWKHTSPAPARAHTTLLLCGLDTQASVPIGTPSAWSAFDLSTCLQRLFRALLMIPISSI